MTENSLSLADQAAFAKFAEEHRPRLLAMLSRRIDPRLAKRISPEDICNDAFVAAQRRWAKFNVDPQGMTPYTWLFGMARSRLIDRWREAVAGVRDVRKEMPWPEQSSIAFGLDLVAGGTTPTQAVARQEFGQRLQETLGLLKPNDREILWMRYFDDMTFREIGQVLKIEEGTARVRYVRAIRRLKELWRHLHPNDFSSQVALDDVSASEDKRGPQK